MATGFVQIDFLAGVGEGWGQGSDSSPSHLVADGEVARCAAPPQKPTPASALRATSSVCPGIFYTPQGVNTPNFFAYTPDQFELVTPVGVKSWTDAEATPGIY